MIDPVFEIINTLQFTRNGGGYEAIPDDYFWFLWKKDKEILRRSGISCTKKEISGKSQFVVVVPQALYQSKLFTYNSESVDTDYPPILKSSFLKPYQVAHTQALISAFRSGNIVDGSDTGIGKTFCSIAVAMEFDFSIFVVTPKSVKVQWCRAVDLTGARCHGILNYEALKFGRTDYLSMQKEIVKDKENKIFRWNLPPDVLIIWDEAHRCKNVSSVNAQMMLAAVKQGIPGIALSATIADRPDHFGAVGPLLGLFPPAHYFPWMLDHGMFFKTLGASGKNRILDFSGNKYHLWKIHKAVFPHHGHRVTKRELGELFPSNHITAHSCEMDNAVKIDQVYRKMHKELRDLAKKKEQDVNQEHPLTIRLRARQEIELLKVPTFVEMTRDALEEGNSVIIFVNFVETLVSLQHHLGTKCTIYGGQDATERQRNIDAFQANTERLIIANIQAGSVGIDLHDTDGAYPRLSLLSPTDRAIDLHQAFGRPHRSGGASPVLQKVIFAAGTVEDRVCENVERKLRNMEVINDGDLEV